MTKANRLPCLKKNKGTTNTMITYIFFKFLNDNLLRQINSFKSAHNSLQEALISRSKCYNSTGFQNIFFKILFTTILSMRFCFFFTVCIQSMSKHLTFSNSQKHKTRPCTLESILQNCLPGKKFRTRAIQGSY